MTAKLSQFGLLALALLAVGAQVPEQSNYRAAAGLFSLPHRSVDTTSTGNPLELLSNASRFKSTPRPDWPFTLAAAAGVVDRSDSGDPLAGSAIPVFVSAPSFAHSGRSPPSA